MILTTRERHRYLHLLRTALDGYDYNPGDSDLDNEQPIYVRMTLKEYRALRSLMRDVEDAHDPTSL